jgi:cysteine desulfurase/selenocysteine lyase
VNAGATVNVLPAWDIEAVREHFLFPATGRMVTNNAASTQPPRELITPATTFA